MLHTRNENAINLTHTLHSSENLSDWFTAFITGTEDLILKCNATMANCTMLTAQIM
jgi:hypothetical protein